MSTYTEEKILTLHPDGSPTVAIYPNIKLENIGKEETLSNGLLKVNNGSVQVVADDKATVSQVNTKQDKLTSENAGENITITTDESSGIVKIKATGSGGTSDYTALTNKPQINNVELNGNKTLNDLGIINFSGNYNDLTNKPTIPTVNDATISIKQGSTVKGSFTLNQSSSQVIEIDAGGSGGTSDYDALNNRPIENQDLDANFAPTLGKYYRHTGTGVTPTGTALEVNDSVSTIYFDTTSTPDLSVFDYSEDEVRLIESGISTQIYDMISCCHISYWTESQSDVGYMIYGEDFETVLYASNAFDYDGNHYNAGWQNLTQGAFVLPNYEQGHSILTLNQTTGWNGVWCSKTSFEPSSQYTTGTIYQCTQVGGAPTITPFNSSDIGQLPSDLYLNKSFDYATYLPTLTYVDGLCNLIETDDDRDVILTVYNLSELSAEGIIGTGYAIGNQGCDFYYATGSFTVEGEQVNAGWQSRVDASGKANYGTPSSLGEISSINETAGWNGVWASKTSFEPVLPVYEKVVVESDLEKKIFINGTITLPDIGSGGTGYADVVVSESETQKLLNAINADKVTDCVLKLNISNDNDTEDFIYFNLTNYYIDDENIHCCTYGLIYYSYVMIINFDDDDKEFGCTIRNLALPNFDDSDDKKCLTVEVTPAVVELKEAITATQEGQTDTFYLNCYGDFDFSNITYDESVGTFPSKKLFDLGKVGNEQLSLNAVKFGDEGDKANTLWLILNNSQPYGLLYYGKDGEFNKGWVSNNDFGEFGAFFSELFTNRYSSIYKMTDISFSNIISNISDYKKWLSNSDSFNIISSSQSAIKWKNPLGGATENNQFLMSNIDESGNDKGAKFKSFSTLVDELTSVNGSIEVIGIDGSDDLVKASIPKFTNVSNNSVLYTDSSYQVTTTQFGSNNSLLYINNGAPAFTSGPLESNQVLTYNGSSLCWDNPSIIKADLVSESFTPTTGSYYKNIGVSASTSYGNVEPNRIYYYNGESYKELLYQVKPSDILTGTASQGQVLTVGTSGAEWANITASVVESIDGIYGALSTGSGLTMDGSSIKSTGVLSFGGAAGAIGIGSGLTISNNVVSATGGSGTSDYDVLTHKPIKNQDFYNEDFEPTQGEYYRNTGIFGRQGFEEGDKVHYIYFNKSEVENNIATYLPSGQPGIELLIFEESSASIVAANTTDFGVSDGYLLAYNVSDSSYVLYSTVDIPAHSINKGWSGYVDGNKLDLLATYTISEIATGVWNGIDIYNIIIPKVSEELALNQTYNFIYFNLDKTLEEPSQDTVFVTYDYCGEEEDAIVYSLSNRTISWDDAGGALYNFSGENVGWITEHPGRAGIESNGSLDLRNLGSWNGFTSIADGWNGEIIGATEFKDSIAQYPTGEVYQCTQVEVESVPTAFNTSDSYSGIYFDTTKTLDEAAFAEDEVIIQISVDDETHRFICNKASHKIEIGDAWVYNFSTNKWDTTLLKDGYLDCVDAFENEFTFISARDDWNGEIISSTTFLPTSTILSKVLNDSDIVEINVTFNDNNVSATLEECNKLKRAIESGKTNIQLLLPIEGEGIIYKYNVSNIFKIVDNNSYSVIFNCDFGSVVSTITASWKWNQETPITWNIDSTQLMEIPEGGNTGDILTYVGCEGYIPKSLSYVLSKQTGVGGDDYVLMYNGRTGEIHFEESTSIIDDYDDLDNIPIINKDLYNTFTPELGTYYKHYHNGSAPLVGTAFNTTDSYGKFYFDITKQLERPNINTLYATFSLGESQVNIAYDNIYRILYFGTSEMALYNYNTSTWNTEISEFQNGCLDLTQISSNFKFVRDYTPDNWNGKMISSTAFTPSTQYTNGTIYQCTNISGGTGTPISLNKPYQKIYFDTSKTINEVNSLLGDLSWSYNSESEEWYNFSIVDNYDEETGVANGLFICRGEDNTFSIYGVSTNSTTEAKTYTYIYSSSITTEFPVAGWATSEFILPTNTSFTLIDNEDFQGSTLPISEIAVINGAIISETPFITGTATLSKVLTTADSVGGSGLVINVEISDGEVEISPEDSAKVKQAILDGKRDIKIIAASEVGDEIYGLDLASIWINDDSYTVCFTSTSAVHSTNIQAVWGDEEDIEWYFIQLELATSDKALPSSANAGDIMIYDASAGEGMTPAWTKKSINQAILGDAATVSPGQVLTINNEGTAAVWATPSGGGLGDLTTLSRDASTGYVTLGGYTITNNSLYEITLLDGYGATNWGEGQILFSTFNSPSVDKFTNYSRIKIYDGSSNTMNDIKVVYTPSNTSLYINPVNSDNSLKNAAVYIRKIK